MSGIVRLHAGHALALLLPQILFMCLPLEARPPQRFRLEVRAGRLRLRSAGEGLFAGGVSGCAGVGWNVCASGWSPMMPLETPFFRLSA
ncbi:hypothetical protein AAFX91_38420 [Bradyrhizobium sp. 31Argb]|uniref:hypothetical protein n=1 Tax=Bradyrhizobium sp. 31Argb TaxID=3141247 RepID=UPI003749AB05